GRLKLFPDRWAQYFFIEQLPDEDRHAAGSDTWEFVYRLRPKHQKVAAIDGIKLVYYEPGKNGGGPFPTDPPEPTELTVLPRPPPPPVDEKLVVRTAPATFYELPGALSAPPRPAWEAAPWLLAVLVLAPPLVTIVGLSFWRRLSPNARRRG